MTKPKLMQVADQCRAVAHIAKAMADVHNNYALIFREQPNSPLVETIGRRTAHAIEELGNMLNATGAIVDEEDSWLDPIFEEARRLWPEVQP